MSFSRPYQIVLRVFEPVDQHPELADYVVEDNRERREEQLRVDAIARLISLPPDPLPPSPGEPLFLPGYIVDDGVDRVCPGQQDILSWQSVENMVSHAPSIFIKQFVPQTLRRKASARRLEWLQDTDDTRVFSWFTTWDVPTAWAFLFHYKTSDAITTSVAGKPRTFIRTSIDEAQAYPTEFIENMDDVSELETLNAHMHRLSEWLGSFHHDSIVELDLGGMSEIIDFWEWLRITYDWFDCAVEELKNDQKHHSTRHGAVTKFQEHVEKFRLYALSS